MNILILTSIYPAADLPATYTPVVHYFVREWQREGHKVRVIHNLTVYPKPYYRIASCLAATLTSAAGSTIPTRWPGRQKTYSYEGVEVERIPVRKYVPHGRFSDKSLKAQAARIIASNREKGFVPDLVAGHWTNPQLMLLGLLKEEYGCPATLVMHDGGASITKLFPNQARMLLDKIDVWGFRSDAIRKNFISLYGKPKQSFLCCSGIDEKLLCEPPVRAFTMPLRSFLFVGMLISRKHPAAILRGLEKVYPDGDFTLDYIGEGAEAKRLKRYCQAGKLDRAVKLHGRMPRESVQEYMRTSDCFVMISESEAYGLVYLEAMSAGCITIASLGEGFDGIIRHGENGFLCPAGDSMALAELIRHINALPAAEKQRISRNAAETARHLTDRNAARDYLAAATQELKENK